MSKKQDVEEFVTDLDMLEQVLARFLPEVAASVIEQEKKGKVTITFDIARIGGAQVMVKHSVALERPTEYGNATEKDTRSTPMYVNENGNMSFFPENQTQMFDKKGEVNKQHG